MIGLDGAGKSSILYRLKNNDFVKIGSTVGLNLETIHHNHLELLMFDVGGKARDLWSYYYEGLDALIFVIDSTDELRISIVKEEIARAIDTLKNNKYVILFYVNKQDAQKKMDMADVVRLLEIDDLEAGVDFII